jgi:hypothetical protein
MKAFLWLLFLALSISSFSCWMVSRSVVVVLAETYLNFPWPGVTNLLLRPNGWILLVPLPWSAYAGLLSFREN